MRTDDYTAFRYLISVEGTKLKEDVTQFVESVAYEEGDELAAKVELQLLNPGFQFSESKIFAEGNAIDVWMGYVGKPLTFMNRGIVMKPNPTFPRSGFPRITVVAHDVTRKLMNTGKDDKGKTYRKKRDSEIAEDIFKEVEVAPFTEQTKGLRTRTRKKGTTRWEFLKRLARLNGYVVDVRYDEKMGTWLGWFGPAERTEQEEKFKFSYGTGEPDATLLEFYPDFSLPSQETSVEVAYTDPKTKKFHRLKVEVTKKDAEKTKFTADAVVKGFSRKATTGKRPTDLKKSIPNGPTVTLTVFGQSEEVIADRAFGSVKDARRFAAAWFHRRQSEFVFGRGTLLGVASLRKGQVHELKGLGNRFSGDWQFTSVIHRQQKGSVYEVEFTATKAVLSSVVSAPGNVSKVKAKETAL